MLLNGELIQRDSERQWFAVRVKSRWERTVASAAHNKGFEEFLPLYWCRKRHHDRFQSVELPLFPGYVFCRLNPRHRLPLLTIPGVIHIVGVGGVPAPIDGEEISAIQCVARSGLEAEPWPFLESGHTVFVEYGPLAGLEGTLIDIRKSRVVVSVTLLRRSLAVEVERNWVRPGRRHPSSSFVLISSGRNPKASASCL